MTTENALVKVGSSVTPPLTRQQLLRATAEVMAQEHLARMLLAESAISKARTKRDAKLRKLAARRIRSASMCVYQWTRNNNLVVSFEVDVPESEVADEQKELRACPVMKRKSVDEFYAELRAATSKTDTRVHELLKDASFRAKLLETGNALLSKPEAITV